MGQIGVNLLVVRTYWVAQVCRAGVPQEAFPCLLLFLLG